MLTVETFGCPDTEPSGSYHEITLILVFKYKKKKLENKTPNTQKAQNKRYLRMQTVEPHVQNENGPSN